MTGYCVSTSMFKVFLTLNRDNEIEHPLTPAMIAFVARFDEEIYPDLIADHVIRGDDS
jgi:hypothetical protein